jgi:outer membrane protein assembly factor BamB
MTRVTDPAGRWTQEQAMKLQARILAMGILGCGAFYFLVCRQPASLRGAAQIVKTSVKTAAKTEVKKTAAAKSAMPANRNPFKRFIRNLIPPPTKTPILPQGGKTVDLKVKDDPATRARSIRARDHIDSRAPHDPDDIKRLRRAESLVKDGQYDAAMNLVQRLLDRQQDSLIRNANDEWVSIRQQANELLAKFPKQFRDAYRLKYGAAARDRLEEGLKTGDLKTLADVATRYFHTESGLEAAQKLAAIYLDRGEYGIAARWFARVLGAEQSNADDPKWLLQAAYAFRRSGDFPESQRLLKRIDKLVADNSLVLGGRPVQPAEWLNKFQAASGGATQVSEWRALFGTSSRTGTVAGGDPLLLSRWSQPTTHSHIVRRHIDRLLEALTDNRRAVIPAAIPLTVGGKVIFRTLRGVLVVDAESGSPLWESREGISAEQLLSGKVPTTNYSRFSRTYYSPNPSGYGDFHPLTGLLFHNGNYGLISSDGDRLFVIEQMALLPNVSPYSRYSSDPEQNDAYRRSWMTNKLTAYDLNSGRPVWEVGGRLRTESFDLPLAGNYFLGVPIADGGELFVVGESNSRIRLHCLDAKTGRAKWSRLIAYSDTKISQDSVRRWITAQVAIRDGVVVCPTSVGWLVAVDRTNRSIVWAHRYSKPEARPTMSTMDGTSQHNVQATPLNQRWVPSAPVISGGYVVYTPQEDESTVCLRLRDGKRMWRIPKGDYLYHAGVFGENVVLVGKDKITAVKLQEGTTAWTQAIDKSAGMPSGMGVAVQDGATATHPSRVAVGGQYHVPLQRGQLWTVDVKTGKVVRKLFLPADSKPLGNLTMYRGQVLSLTPSALTSFEQRSALLAKIEQRKKAAAGDAWAALKEAEIALLHRDFKQALASLRRVDAGKLDATLDGRYRKATITTLSAVVRSDFKRNEAELRQLEAFVKTPEEKFQFKKLAVERHDARKELPEAFRLYRQLAGENPDAPVQRGDDHRLETTVRFWVAGRLRDVWDRMSQESRQGLGAELEKEAAELATADNPTQLRFARLFSFHPIAVTVVNRLIEKSLEQGNFAVAEQLLTRLRRHADAKVAAAATERYARLLLSRNLPDDAAPVYLELQRKYPDVLLANGKTAGKLVAELKARQVLNPRSGGEPVSWGKTKMRVEQSGTQYRSHPDQELIIGTNGFPFFRNHSFQIDHNGQQLLVTRTSDEKLAWLVPLRAQANAPSGQYVHGSSFGHLVFVLHRNVLHCLSPVDRRVVWTRSLEDRGNSNGMYYSYYSSSPVQNRYRPLTDGRNVVNSHALSKDMTHQGGLAFANENCVGIYGRRRLIVVDTLTGNVLWVLRGLTQGSRAVATNEAVFVLNSIQAGDSVAGYRVLDGRKLPSFPSSSLGARTKIAAAAVGVIGNEFLHPDVTTRTFLGLGSSTTSWKLQNPLTGKTVWKRDYKTGASFTVLDDGSLVALPRRGPLEIVDRRNGRVATYPFEPAKSGGADQVYVLADRDTLFVIANSRRRGGSHAMYYGYGTLSTIAVFGDVYAFDRGSRTLLWKKAVSNRQLVMDYFEQSPVLTFNTRKYVNNGMVSHALMSFLAIDKRTGLQLIDAEIPSTQYYGSFSVNLSDRYVEFRTYSHRLRLVAVDDGPVKAIRPRRRGAVKAVKPVTRGDMNR